MVSPVAPVFPIGVLPLFLSVLQDRFDAVGAILVLSQWRKGITKLRTARRRSSGRCGLIRLAYTPLALQTVLPWLLAAFQEQDHDMRIDLGELIGAAQQAAPPVR